MKSPPRSAPNGLGTLNYARFGLHYIYALGGEWADRAFVWALVARAHHPIIFSGLFYGFFLTCWVARNGVDPSKGVILIALGLIEAHPTFRPGAISWDDGLATHACRAWVAWVAWAHSPWPAIIVYAAYAITAHRAATALAFPILDDEERILMTTPLKISSSVFHTADDADVHIKVYGGIMNWYLLRGNYRMSDLRNFLMRLDYRKNLSVIFEIGAENGKLYIEVRPSSEEIRVKGKTWEEMDVFGVPSEIINKK